MANIFRPSKWLNSQSDSEKGSPARKDEAPRRNDDSSRRAGEREAMTASRFTENEAIERTAGLGDDLRVAQNRQAALEQPPVAVIEERAYFKWCEAGCPEGRDKEFWLAAEREVLDEMQGKTRSIA